MYVKEGLWKWERADELESLNGMREWFQLVNRRETILPENSQDKGFNITLLLTFMRLCLDHAVKKLVLMFCFNFNILLHKCQVTVQADQ